MERREYGLSTYTVVSTKINHCQNLETVHRKLCPDDFVNLRIFQVSFYAFSNIEQSIRQDDVSFGRISIPRHRSFPHQIANSLYRR